MPSPFPGMDPYLERHWLDVHTVLVAYARRALNRSLPHDLLARVEERVAIESDAEDDGDGGDGGRDEPKPRKGRVGPDVRVAEYARTLVRATPRAGSGTALAPLVLEPRFEPAVERFVRIVEAEGERLVTVLEIINPSDKVGEGMAKFRRKRDELLAAGVNFVEVDLVRHGDWRGLLEPAECSTRAAGTYRASMRVVGQSVVHLHPMSLRERLPTINVPLRPSDEPARFDLQALLDDVYEDGRYGYSLNYTREPKPPLAPDDALWADELLRAAGKRPAPSAA